jgi:hypothetical protein
MYRSKILNRIKLDYFLKFVVHELNYEMVESEMVVLTGRRRLLWLMLMWLWTRSYSLLLKS